MLEYVLKSSACMLAFLLFYHFLLEKENMHQFKRFFLLAALIISLIIPKLVFTEYVVAAPSILSAVPGLEVEQVGFPATKQATDMNVVNWSKLLWSLYVLGILGFGIRFCHHLYQILQRIRKNPKLRGNTVVKVLLQEKIPPHTFFCYVFLNNTDFKQKNIPDEVLLHEETHAKQYHSLDILFVELAQIILWFNPLLLLFKRNIKLNHEFLADKAVLKEKADTKRYQNTLLSYLSGDSEGKYQPIKMVNAINYPFIRAERPACRSLVRRAGSRSIKKRFTIMKKETSKKSTILRILVVLPFVALLVYGFSEKQIVEREALPITQDILTVQEGASREQMKEYNALAKKYNAMPKNRMHIVSEEVERLEYIYSIMSDTQRANVESFPDFPEPPPSPKAPKPPKNISDVQYASNRIDSIINTQDPYDEVNGNIYLSLLSSPTPLLPPVHVHVKEMSQKGASTAQMKEYNTLAKKYNAMPKNRMRIVSEEVERLEYIYSLMSDKQRQDAEPFPNFPEPPEPPMPPIPSNAMEAHIQAMEEQHLALEKQAREMEIQHKKMQRKKAHLTEQNLLKIEEQARKLEAKQLEMEQKAKKMEQQALEIEQRSLEMERQYLKNPPPPPAPKSPLEHIREMGQKNAIFYHNGKEIPAEKAMDLLKNHKRIKLETSHGKGTRPEVRLFTKR